MTPVPETTTASVTESVGVREHRLGVNPAPAPALTVIVPITGSTHDLAKMHTELSSALSRHGETVEFLFVGQAGAVNAVGGLLATSAHGGNVRVLEVGGRVGESDLIVAARAHCRGELLVTIPPYRSIHPDDLMALIREVRAGADLASASRSEEGTHWMNRLQRRSFHRALNWLLDAQFNDLASGIRVMKPVVLDEVPIYGDTFRFLPFLAAREAFRVVEVDVRAHEHERRLKVYSPGIYLRRAIDLLGMAFLTRFTHKPLRFFGLVGTLTALAGGTILTTMVYQRLGGTPVADRPAMVLGVMLVVLGAQAIALGLIGEIIVHFNVGERHGYRVWKERSVYPFDGGPESTGPEEPAAGAASYPTPGEQRKQ